MAEIPKIASFTEMRPRPADKQDAIASLSFAMAHDLLSLAMDNVVLMAAIIDHIRPTDPETAAKMEAEVRKMQGRIDSMIDNMRLEK